MFQPCTVTVEVVRLFMAASAKAVVDDKIYGTIICFWVRGFLLF
ncbi:hypothetical protein ALO54_102342 [Pseudomonas syringae pv. philadelphi]|uniref:Uncharacterized protein n=1 Tax=Pseudomonas syringae pv. antirrhini TaxID=251702 RepID=A0A0P9K7M7_9PSED|nr:hypothetical protein ALO88_102545 [Pseudomonas syringae pv. antirrhini]KPW56928.1 hypothetical protein ALO86_102078 [Pseudomonas syringae pv. berberidis]KPY27069.1 hypothetical protein ALO54_102342 [Pseudomonas syringae pv. philadelphi]RMR28778.1 hypothetical protein ALP87_102577 [Pseudomonas syringae pv. coriandricola]RMP28728.1 hypothetical protein ALQ24_102654 [Pseudomonas syringae pv. antirrhini]